jgi:hypothetical protein
MHSMVSTCPQVGARHYAPFLGITKDIMSHNPWVVDMDYREASQHIDPFIHYTSPFDNIQHT